MSRKANNLRKRLRVERDRNVHYHLALALNKRLVGERDAYRHQLQMLRHELTFPKSLMVRVEQEWGRGRPDLWGVAVTFAPDSYARMILRESHGGDARNLSLMAKMIGEEIGEKVGRTILERFTANGVPPTANWR